MSPELRARDSNPRPPGQAAPIRSRHLRRINLSRRISNKKSPLLPRLCGRFGRVIAKRSRIGIQFGLPLPASTSARRTARSGEPPDVLHISTCQRSLIVSGWLSRFPAFTAGAQQIYSQIRRCKGVSGKNLRYFYRNFFAFSLTQKPGPFTASRTRTVF